MKSAERGREREREAERKDNVIILSIFTFMLITIKDD
jgi:hypothetical protein